MTKEINYTTKTMFLTETDGKFWEDAEVVIKDFNHFQELVIKWADERNMFCPDNGATVGSQFAKLMEEVGELGKGLLEKDKEQIKDAIGDCAVVLVILSRIARQSRQINLLTLPY